MAKKEQKIQLDALSDDALSLEMERALAETAWEESITIDAAPEQKPEQKPAPEQRSAPQQASAETRPAPVRQPTGRTSGSDFDIAALNGGHAEIQNRLRNFVESFEGLGKSWEGFGDQLARANVEIERLRGVERNRGELAARVDEMMQRANALETEVRDAKAASTQASERAAKFEDLYESMKERAVELNTAIQDAEVKEKALNEEMESIRSQLAETGRRAQDEAMARTAAEESIKKLEASDLASRDRIAKLLGDNKAMADQVPVLLAERDRLTKQLAASERENARLNNERQLSSVRMADLEEEIRTLRADLATPGAGRSVSMPAAAPLQTQPATQSAPAKQSAPAADSAADADALNMDFNLEESLEEAFARDMANFSTPAKR